MICHDTVEASEAEKVRDTEKISDESEEDVSWSEARAEYTDNMQGVRKIARSGSLIVEELFGGKNKRVEVDPAEVEYESGFNGR